MFSPAGHHLIFHSGLSMPDNLRRIPVIPPCSRRVTPREVACLELAHLSNADIARILGISIETVKAHLASAYVKLGAENRTAAALLWAERRAA
jgi:DNA-binding CsgD family transcriptional regulator